MTKAKRIAFLAIGVATCVAISFSISSFERPLMDYLDNYKVLHYVRDPNTGKIIELGTLYNFGSTEYEVGVYDDVNPERSKLDLRQQNISLVGGPSPNPGEVQFDGKCYFVTAMFNEEMSRIRPVWRDGRGKEICFYALMPNGTKIGR